MADMKITVVDAEGIGLHLREASTRIFEVNVDLSQPLSGAVLALNTLKRVHSFTIKSLGGGAVLRMAIGQGAGSFKVNAGETRDNLSVDQLLLFCDGGVGWNAVIEVQGR